MCTPCLRYHSIDCSNGPFGGGIRFPSFQNENEPQCPPCGRQIAARLPSVPALPWELQMQSCPFKIGKRGKKKYWHSRAHRFPVVSPTQRRRLQWGKRQKGLSAAALLPCRLFIYFAYLHVHLESPPPAPWIGLGGWMWHVAISSFLNGMCSYSVQNSCRCALGEGFYMSGVYVHSLSNRFARTVQT